MPESNFESNPDRESNLESKFRSLDLTEAKILYYKCLDTKYRRIRKLLDISQDDYEAATARMYVKIGFNLALRARQKPPELKAKFCPSFERLLERLPGEGWAKFEHWPPPAEIRELTVVPTQAPEAAPEAAPPLVGIVPYDFDAALRAVKEEIVDEDLADDGGGQEDDDEEDQVRALPGGSRIIVPNGKSRRRWWIVALLWLLSLCLVAGIAVGLGYLLSLRSAAPPVSATQMVVATAAPLPATATALPSQTAAVVPTNLPVASTTQMATQTPWIVTATSLPATLPPAASALPAATATPAFQLPFTETFDQSLRPEWSKRGNFLIIQGWLGAASNDEVDLTVGAMSLDNYQVSLDFRPSSPGDFYEFSLQFGANLRLKARYSELQWYLSQDGTSFNQAGDAFFKPGAGGTLAVQVRGSTANVILNGHQSQQATYSYSMAGPITLILTSNRTQIDNFNIDALP